jgi:shikimate kinase
MNVLLIGMKHCGKSTLGQALARRWNCSFYDVDPMIEDNHACEADERLSVREIFSRYGEQHFHRIEGHVVCELYLKLDHPGSTSVVSLGGRTALNETICKLLSAIGLVVYIEVPAEELFHRIERKGLPPFLDDQNPKADFERLYRERAPQYQQLADVVVKLENCTPEQAVEKLVERIEEHCHARK